MRAGVKLYGVEQMVCLAGEEIIARSMQAVYRQDVIAFYAARNVAVFPSKPRARAQFLGRACQEMSKMAWSRSSNRLIE
jgi:hypothetical protein